MIDLLTHNVTPRERTFQGILPLGGGRAAEGLFCAQPQAYNGDQDGRQGREPDQDQDEAEAQAGEFVRALLRAGQIFR